MKAAVRAEMLKIAEGKSDGSAAVEMTVDDLLAIVDSALYPNMNAPYSIGKGYGASKAVAALEGLQKLGYDKRDLDALKAYFAHCAEADDLRTDAGRALGRMRDEYWADKDKKSTNGHAGAGLKRAY